MLAAAALLLAGCPGQGGGQGAQARAGLVVVGSDTMRGLGQAWGAALSATHPGTPIEVRGGGTGAGVAALLAGEADLCLASRELPPEEQALCQRHGVALWRAEVGRDGVVIAVHPGNPVRELSLPQLRGLLTGEVSTWDALGGEARPVHVVSRETRSGTHAFLREHLLEPGRLPDAAELCATSEDVARAVAREPGAIGYLGLGPASHAAGLGLVAIRPAQGTPGVLPSPASVADGSYALSRPLLIYARAEPAGLAGEYVALARSPAGQARLKEEGFAGLGPGE